MVNPIVDKQGERRYYLAMPPRRQERHQTRRIERKDEIDCWFPRHRLPKTPDQDLLLIGCPQKLLPLINRLDTPLAIQFYVDTHLTYSHANHTRSIIDVVKDESADCFEGAVFCYTLLLIHGYHPRIVLMQADNAFGQDHNIVAYREDNRLGSIAMSEWKTLKSRPPIYSSLGDLIASYWDDFTSELPENQGKDIHNLNGYSDPINPMDKFPNFAQDFMFKPGQDALKSIYDHYAEDLMCTHLFTNERYLYPDEDQKLPSLDTPHAR